MDSAMTITQWEVDNSNRESAKPAKLSQEKVNNLDNKRRKFHAKNEETASKLKAPGIQSKEFADKFKMTIIKNGHIVVKLNSGRKLKVKRVVSDGTLKFYSESINEGNAIEMPIVHAEAPIVNETVQVESNIREFPSRTMLQTQPVANENITEEPVNNMYSFATGAPITTSKSEVKSDNNLANSIENNNSNNTLSRLSRMDYNANASSSVEKTDAFVRDNTVSIDDYLQHGKVKNSDRDLAMLMENNEKLNSEINESQRVLEQLEIQLAKLKEISEAKRQARISELKEENLSKTATLNGLTEQIKALQEAIRLEQQTANESTMRRVA